MSDLREALEGAFDEAENQEASAGAEVEVSNDLPTEIDTPETETDVAETVDAEARGEGEGEGEEKPAEVKTEEGEQPTEQRADSEVKTEKPPVSWSPKNREHWAKLPDELKVQINKREREVNQVLQQTAQDRRTANAFMKTIEPYRPVMIAQGVENPLEAINELMKTAATLGSGTPQQKAMRIAGLIQHYGVDINALDSVLAGEQQQQQQQDPNAYIQQAVNQAVAPLLQQQQMQQQHQQQQVRQKAAEGVQRVSQREFFEDLREDMADILQLAGQRGQQMTIEEAYDRAAKMHPEISSVLAAREAQSSIADKKAAASGISGNKSGLAPKNTDLSLHDTLEAAWNGNLS